MIENITLNVSSIELINKINELVNEVNRLGNVERITNDRTPYDASIPRIRDHK